MSEYNNNLAKFFDANVRPSFEEFGWAEQEIAALKGAFFLGAQFTTNNMDNLDDIIKEVDEFQTNVNKRTRDH